MKFVLFIVSCLGQTSYCPKTTGFANKLIFMIMLPYLALAYATREQVITNGEDPIRTITPPGRGLPAPPKGWTPCKTPLHLYVIFLFLNILTINVGKWQN